MAFRSSSNRERLLVSVANLYSPTSDKIFLQSGLDWMSGPSNPCYWLA